MGITLKEFFLHEEPVFKGFSQGMSFDDYFAEFSAAADTGGMPSSELEAAAKIAYRRGQSPEQAAIGFMNKDTEDYDDEGFGPPEIPPENDTQMGKKLGRDFGRDVEPPPPPAPPEPDDDFGSIEGEPMGDMDQFHLTADDYPETGDNELDDLERSDSFADVTHGRNPRDIGYTQSTQFNDEEPIKAHEALEPEPTPSRNPSPRQSPGQGSPSFGRTGKVTPQDSITTEDILGGTGPSSWSDPTDKVMQLKDFIPESVYEPGDPDYDYTFEEMQELAPKEMAELQQEIPDQNEIMMGTFQVERKWDRDDMEGAKIWFIPATGEKPYQYDNDWGWSEMESAPGKRPESAPDDEEELTFDDDEAGDLPADDIAREPEAALTEPEDPAELPGAVHTDVGTEDDEELPSKWWGDDK